MSSPVGFSIGYASSITGLSTHVIRAWERRYQAVSPVRSPGGRRLFSQMEIDRLKRLKQLIASGHSISHIAGLDDAALSELAGQRRALPSPTGALPSGGGMRGPEQWLDDSLRAVVMLDGTTLSQVLQDAALHLNRQALLTRIIQPFMEAVGDQWSRGSLRIVHGHVAAAVVQAQLNTMLTQGVDDDVPKPFFVVAAPAGQCCCLGALAVAVTAQDHGWRACFLGYNLPAEEIAAAVETLTPQLVALSITCRINDLFMQNELRRLAQLVDGRCPLVVGGRASYDYRGAVAGYADVHFETTEGLIGLLQ